jgi:hypothetical protein
VGRAARSSSTRGGTTTVEELSDFWTYARAHGRHYSPDILVGLLVGPKVDKATFVFLKLDLPLSQSTGPNAARKRAGSPVSRMTMRLRDEDEFVEVSITAMAFLKSIEATFFLVTSLMATKFPPMTLNTRRLGFYRQHCPPSRVVGMRVPRGSVDTAWGRLLGESIRAKQTIGTSMPRLGNWAAGPVAVRAAARA